MSFHFEALHSQYFSGMLSYAGASLMLKPSLLGGFTSICGFSFSQLVLGSLAANVNVISLTKGTFLLLQMNRSQGRIRSGVVKGEPWSPPFIVSFSLPNHHSQYPTGASLTPNICPTLPLWWWRDGSCDGHSAAVWRVQKLLPDISERYHLVHLLVPFMCPHFTSTNNRCLHYLCEHI